MPEQLPIVQYPFYDPREQQNPFASGQITQAVGGFGRALGRAIDEAPFKKRQIKMMDQRIAREALMQKRREEADKMAADQPQVLGFRYDFHIGELTEKFNKMEEGPVKDYLGEQITQMKGKRDYFFDLGKREHKIKQNVAMQENDNLEKVYRAIGDITEKMEANVLSSGKYADTPELMRTIAQQYPKLAGQDVKSLTGTQAQIIEEKGKFAKQKMLAETEQERLKETGKTERERMRLEAKKGAPGTRLQEEKLEFQREKSLQPLYKQRDSNLRKIKENQEIIDRFERGEKIKKGKTKGIMGEDVIEYYEDADIKDLSNQINILKDENLSILKRIERLGIRRTEGVSPEGMVETEVAEIKTPEGTVEAEKEAVTTPEGTEVKLKAGVNLNNLREAKTIIQQQASKAKDKQRVQEILSAIEMIDTGNEKQAQSAVNLLKTKYPDLYNLIKGTP